MFSSSAALHIGVARRRRGLIARICLLGLPGGAAVGGLFAVVSIAAVNGPAYDNQLGFSFGFAVGLVIGLLTGAAASAAFLLVWWASANIRRDRLRCLLAALASGVVITCLMAFVWLSPNPSGSNWTLGEVTFDWVILLGCIAAALVYYWVGSAFIARSMEPKR